MSFISFYLLVYCHKIWYLITVYLFITLLVTNPSFLLCYKTTEHPSFGSRTKVYCTATILSVFVISCAEKSTIKQYNRARHLMLKGLNRRNEHFILVKKEEVLFVSFHVVFSLRRTVRGQKLVYLNYIKTKLWLCSTKSWISQPHSCTLWPHRTRDYNKNSIQHSSNYVKFIILSRF